MGSGAEEQTPAEVVKMIAPRRYSSRPTASQCCAGPPWRFACSRRLQLWIPRLTGFVVPSTVALVYIVCIGRDLPKRDGGFGSIGEVRAVRQ